MEIDGTLVMEQFFSHMGNFIITLSFVGILTLCATGVYVYFVHHDKDEEWD